MNQAFKDQGRKEGKSPEIYRPVNQMPKLGKLLKDVTEKKKRELVRLA